MSDGSAISVNELQIQLDAAQARIKELEQELVDNKTCNRCGRENKASDVKVSDTVLKDYFRSLLGQTPFTHTFEAFDGMLLITCVAPQGDILIERYKNRMGKPARMEDLLASTVSRVAVVDKASGYTRAIYEATGEQLAEAVNDPVTRYNELLASMDAIKLAVVKNAFHAFSLLISVLIDEASTEDFYTGAGLV